jgi:hypothetical protein
MSSELVRLLHSYSEVMLSLRTEYTRPLAMGSERECARRIIELEGERRQIRVLLDAALRGP